MNKTKGRGVGTAGNVVRLSGILCLAIGSMSCATDETVNPPELSAELTEVSSHEGSLGWKRRLRIDPDSATISGTGKTLQLTATRISSIKSDEPPTEVEAKWFVLDREVLKIEGSATSTSTVLLRGLKPGKARIVAINNGSVGIASVRVGEGDGDGDPDGDDGGQGQLGALAAVLSGAPPVLLVGDTVPITIWPNLIGEDSVVIPTVLSEWSVDFDPTYLSFLSDSLVTALAPTPPGSTTRVVLTHVPTELVTQVDVVILSDEDPDEQPDGEPRPPPGEWPDNEPPGMATILAADGSSKHWPGFSQYYEWNDNNRVAVVNDPDSKHGQAIEKRFVMGDESGWHGLTTSGYFGAFRELYVRTVYRVSPDWQWHHSGGKYFYYGAAGRDRYVAPTQFVLGWEGDGTPFWLATDHGRYIAEGVPPNSRNVYHTIEIHHVASTDGANGSLRMWVDGVEVQSFTLKRGFVETGVVPSNEEWGTTAAMGDKRLSGLQAFLFWGGQSDTKRANDWIRLSELYISGK